MANVVISLSLPEDLLREIDAMAAADHLTRDDVLAASVRRFLASERRWRAIQAVVAERATAAGILTEGDVEDLVDSVSE